jgi:hypothetical protein
MLKKMNKGLTQINKFQLFYRHFVQCTELSA